MAGNSHFDWNDWSNFLNDDADDAFGAQANGLGMQGDSGL